MKITEEKKRILIINLTRMGDLLQMTPFLKGFRLENPDVEITLFVLKQFEDVCTGFPFVDRVESFDSKDLLSKLGKPERSLVANYRTLEKMLDELGERRFDTIINLSFSNHSALLTRLLRAPDLRGITTDDHGDRRLRHPWVNHFYNMVESREINLFNYVDFVRKIGGCSRPAPMTFEVSPSGRAFAENFCRDHGISPSDSVIGFQLGASRKNRWWPTESFGRLAGELIREGTKIVLFGSGGEAALGREVSDYVSLMPDQESSNLFDMTGNTSVDQLAALVERCDLLITCDTGTMHLATSVGTQVVALFFGPAYFPETGPYGEGHLVIQADIPCAPCGHDTACKHPRCRETISVTHVRKVIHILREGTVRSGLQLRDTHEWKGIQLYRGAFDEDGMLEFLPLIRRPLERMDLMKSVYREMWKIILDNRPEEVDSIRVSKKIDAFFDVDGNPLDLEGDHRAFANLAELARQGVEISERLVRWSEDITHNISAIKTAGQIIHTLDEQVELQGLIHRACHPLTFMFRQGKENLDEGDVGSLSRETLKLYKILLHEANLMNRGLRRTVACLQGAA